MAENKTKATEASVEAYLSVIEEDGRRKDCDSIAALMCRITKAQPKMWGSSIVGFDSYHYGMTVADKGILPLSACRLEKAT